MLESLDPQEPSSPQAGPRLAAYEEIIGIRGLVIKTPVGNIFFKAQNVENQLTRAKFFDAASIESIMHIMANYDVYKYYLLLVISGDTDPNSEGEGTYEVFRIEHTAPPEPSSLSSHDQAITALLSTTQFRGADRNLTWFKALVCAEIAGLLTTKEKLNIFKLQKADYMALEPYLIDYIVEIQA
jgi:hypothetical protein